MKNIITSLLLLISCFTTSMSAEIYAASVGHGTSNGEVFEVQFVVQASENDSILNSSDYALTIGNSHSTEVFTIDDASQTNRVKNNSYCHSSFASIWTQTYKATIDLNNTKYKSLLSACNLRISLTLKNRKSGSTLAKGKGEDLYVYDEFTICGSLANKYTPVNNSIYPMATCNEQETYFSLQVYDVNEFDKLSFQLVEPMISLTQSARYRTGFSKSNPLTVDTNTTFKFDQILGDFYFKPTDTSNHLASVSVRITEWRINSAGVYQSIGTNVREVSFLIRDCLSNYPPSLKGPYDTEVCEEEQICFTITTYDKVKLPPPPNPIPDPDSVSLSWNRGIPGATFTIRNPKSLHQSARFCWTPKKGEANSLPYSFTATARDNFCLNPMQTVRAFHVYVRPKPKAKTTVTKIIDTRYLVSINEIDSIQDPKFMLQVKTKDGTLVFDKKKAFYSSTGSFISNKKQDTLVILDMDEYIVQTTIAQKPIGCETNYYDTLSFQTLNVKQNSSTLIILYPNPTQDIVKLNVTLDNLTVTNQLGQVILRAQDTNSFDLSTYQKGVYFIRGTKGIQNFSGVSVKN